MIKAPEKLKTIDWSKVEELVSNITEETCKKGFEVDDDQHYIWEAVMESVYGKVYWNWRRENGIYAV